MRRPSRFALAPFASALGEQQFRRLWLGQSLSAFGDRMVPVALAFAVLDIGGSASDVGYVIAAGLVQRVALMLLGGVWADRLPRQRVMIAADAVRCVTYAMVAVLLFGGTATVWHLAALNAVYGGATAFFHPASTGLVPATVSAGRLQQANALMGLSRDGFGLVAPAAAGVFIAAGGAGTVFAIDAATFLASMWFLARLRLTGLGRREEQRVLKELRAGWSAFRAETWIWVSVCYFSLFNLFVATLFVLGPVVAKAKLGGAPAWGAILTAGTAGSITGGILALRLRVAHPLPAAYASLASFGVVMLLLAHSVSVVAIGAAAAVAFATLSYAAAVWMTTLQANVPPHLISRVSAYDWLGSLLFQPLGFAIVGPIAAGVGVSETLTAAAAALALASLGVAAVPSIRRLRHSGLAPVAAAE
jgi:MFS family permease